VEFARNKTYIIVGCPAIAEFRIIKYDGKIVNKYFKNNIKSIDMV